MRITDQIMTANSNLRKSLMRTVLTSLAIVVGSFTLSMALGLTSGFSAYIKSQIGQYSDVNLYRVIKEGAEGFGAGFSTDPVEYNPNKKVVNNSDFANTILGPTDIEEIKKVEGVKDIRLPYSITNEYVVGSNNKKWSAEISAIIPEIPFDVVSGEKGLSPNDLEGALVSTKYISALFGDDVGSSDAIGKTFSTFFKVQSGDLTERKLTIKGVIAPNIFAQPINVSESLAREFSFTQKGVLADRFSQFYFSKNDNMSDQQVKANLKKLKYDSNSLKDLNNQLNGIVQVIQYGLIAFSAIAILAALIGVVNTLYMSVLERTKEIGLYRALGSSKTSVFTLFSLEAIFIAFWGSSMGIFLSFMAQFGINSYAATSFLKGVDGYKLFSLQLPTVLMIIFIIITVTFLAGILPSRKAAKLDPITALRYE